MHTRDIGHERARELLANAVDFELDDADLDELDAHLAGCRDCRQFAAGLDADQAALAALPRRQAPPSILDAIRREEARRRDPFRPLLVLVAAVTASALFLTTIAGGSHPDHTPSPVVDPSASDVAQASVAPSADASPRPSVGPTEAAASSLAWSQVNRQHSFHEPFGVMEAVAAGSRLVAVGDGCAANLPTCHAAIWTSGDAVTWERVADSPEFDVGPWTIERRGEMTDVVATPNGYVAVGRSREGGGRKAAAWWSNDGLRWSRSDDTKSLEFGTMEAVLSTDVGLIAVGNVVDGNDAWAGGWLSSDGIRWTRTTSSDNTFDVGGPGTFTDGRVHGGMIDAISNGGTVVAVGSACGGGGSCHGVAWGTDDGRSWNRLTDDIVGTPYALADAPRYTGLDRDDKLVAAGDDGHGHPVSWTSPDGINWTAGRPVSGITGNFDALIVVRSVLYGSIVGTDGSSVIATSTDGRSWQILADPSTLGKGAVNGLAWDPVRGVAIGVGWDGQTPAAAVWTGR